MTHASVPLAQRQAVGLNDGMVRISVGLEDIADIEQDFDDALSHVS
jgi:cystathionine beta-lyase/cystathionine gamma-synthase